MKVTRRSFLAMFGLAGIAGFTYTKLFHRARSKPVVTPAFTENNTPLETLLAKSGADLLCRFVSLADTGSGTANQYAVARAMDRYHAENPFSTILLAGDNIYPAGDMTKVGEVFEKPYKTLLEKGISFRACLGNHDVRTRNGEDQLKYAPFNMPGRHYSFEQDVIQFIALDTNINSTFAEQLTWLDTELARSKVSIKIVFGHHPIYACGHYGPNLNLIAKLTPIFKKHHVKLYINGHEHHYERTHCIEGTTYVICGAGGAALRSAQKTPWSAIAESRFSFVAYELYGKKDSASPRCLKIKAIDAANQVFDEAAIQL